MLKKKKIKWRLKCLLSYYLKIDEALFYVKVFGDCFQQIVKCRENKLTSSSQSHALVWTVISTTKRSHPGLNCVVRDLEATRHTNRVCGGTPGYLSPWKLANFLPRGQGRNRRINHVAIRYTGILILMERVIRGEPLLFLSSNIASGNVFIWWAKIIFRLTRTPTISRLRIASSGYSKQTLFEKRFRYSLSMFVCLSWCQTIL